MSPPRPPVKESAPASPACAGTTKLASQQGDGSALEIDGDIYGSYTVSSRKADVKKLLAAFHRKET